jgi:hypothetical protein
MRSNSCIEAVVAELESAGIEFEIEQNKPMFMCDGNITAKIAEYP